MWDLGIFGLKAYPQERWGIFEGFSEMMIRMSCNTKLAKTAKNGQNWSTRPKLAQNPQQESNVPIEQIQLLVICIGHTAWAPRRGAKDEVKRPERPPTSSQGPEGSSTSSLSYSKSTFFRCISRVLLFHKKGKIWEKFQSRWHQPNYLFSHQLNWVIQRKQWVFIGVPSLWEYLPICFH